MPWVFAAPFDEDSFDESHDQLRDAVIGLKRAHERLVRAEDERSEALREMADAHGAMERARAQLLATLPKVTITPGDEGE